MRKIAIGVLALGLVSLGLAMLLAPAPAKIGAKPDSLTWEAYIQSAPTVAQRVRRARERSRVEAEAN